MGGIGFLAELAPDELFSSLEDILAGNYEIAERMVLAATLSDEETEPALYALNDLVVDKGVASRLIRIKTYIDGEVLNIRILDAKLATLFHQLFDPAFRVVQLLGAKARQLHAFFVTFQRNLEREVAIFEFGNDFFQPFHCGFKCFLWHVG